MIPSEAKSLFQNIIVHEMFEMDRTLDSTQQAALRSMASRGLGQSGNAMRHLTENATNSLKARAQFILGQLLRCMATHGVKLDAEALTEARALLGDAISLQATAIRDRLFEQQIFVSETAEQAKRQMQAAFDQEGPRLIDRLSAELKLAAAAQGTPSQGSPSFTFFGPVGLVQTGDGNQATVQQHLDANVRYEITSALQLFLDKLNNSETDSLHNRAELRELIIDAKAEAEKPDPNSLKLGSSLRTIAETTKFVGSLGPAYQVLKPLLSYLGIHLP